MLLHLLMLFFVIIIAVVILKGTSGSSMLGSGINARGVHTFGMSSPTIPWNGGVVFLKGNGIYDDVYRWAGWPNETAPTPVAAPQSVAAPQPTSQTAPQPGPTPATCFSSMNTVEVKDIGSILIGQLRIGDYVRGRNGSFTQVYGFGHRNHNLQTKLLQISFEDQANSKTENGIPLEISSTHLIFVKRNNKIVILPASDVVVGDVMSQGGKVIKEILQVHRHGAYAPLTMSGDIMISGILASNHVEILNNPLVIWNQHLLGQAVWFPRRLICRFSMDLCKNETYNIDGYSNWAYWIIRLGSTINIFGCMGAWAVNILGAPFIFIISVIEPNPYAYVGVVVVAVSVVTYWIRNAFGET